MLQPQEIQSVNEIQELDNSEGSRVCNQSASTSSESKGEDVQFGLFRNWSSLSPRFSEVCLLKNYNNLKAIIIYL